MVPAPILARLIDFFKSEPVGLVEISSWLVQLRVLWILSEWSLAGIGCELLLRMGFNGRKARGRWL